jgi:hypothetical protein
LNEQPLNRGSFGPVTLPARGRVLETLSQDKGFSMILSTVGLGLGAYALGAGSINSAAMIARGGVRAFGSVCHGDVRGASLELLGGLAAPAVGVANQLAALAAEVVGVALSISVGSPGPGETSLPTVTGGDGGPSAWPSGLRQRMGCVSAGTP